MSKVKGEVYGIDQTNGGRTGLGTVANDGIKSIDLSEAKYLLGTVTQALRDGATISKQAERLISQLARS